MDTFRKNIWRKYAFGLCLVALLVIPVVVLAQTTNANSGVIQLPNPINVKDPRELIGRVIGAALGLIGSIALAVFIYGGFLWMTSAGNTERITKGRYTILWAALGLAVIFSSYVLVRNVLEALTRGQQATPPTSGQQAQPP